MQLFASRATIVAVLMLCTTFSFPDDSADPAVELTAASAKHQPAISLAVDFDATELDQAGAGDQFALALPTAEGLLQLTALVRDDDTYVNGDRVLYAVAAPGQPSHILPLNIVITIGQHSILADLMLADQRWVFEGLRHNGRVQGFLKKVEESSRSAHLPSDFVVPDVMTPDGLSKAVVKPTPSPLVMSGHSDSPQIDINTPNQAPVLNGVMASSVLEISQSFDRFAVFVGESAEIEVTVKFRNTGAQSLSRVSADIFFILEDTALISAPACAQTLSNTVPRQPILRCELPGQLLAGASRTLSYRVRMPAKLAPIRLWSTVLSGALRHDAYLNVVNNVAADTNEQGLSRFNQSLLQGVTTDRLGNVVIDVMTLFTPDTETLYGASTPTRINQLISMTNQIYRDSGVGITLRPVHHARVEYPAANTDMYKQLEDLSSNRHPAFRHVPALRQQFGADLVVLFRPLDAQSDLCGLANLGGYQTMGDMLSFNERDNAYALVAIDCPMNSALAHEIGHNMGLTHSHRENGSGGTLPYATGYGVDSQFVTVMATPSRFGNAARVPRFSDPSARCETLPCGVDHTDAAYGADAVRALNLVKYQIASYMPTQVPMMPGRKVGRIDGADSPARIALSVSTDKGLSFAQSVKSGQTMDITAEFYVEPAHIGKRGQFHVLADLSAAGLGMIQLNDQGETFNWDGSVADLKAFSSDLVLKPIEYLRILTDFQPIPAIQGHPLVLFLGYQLPETGELVYTTDPLVVDIGSAP
ncbi:MAG: zinc-dependent metalloprotease family protein [Pseudohongiella sp.]|nr:zinc-dependent metalloprotease family protein [Pseudohongiella sp.]